MNDNNVKEVLGVLLGLLLAVAMLGFNVYVMYIVLVSLVACGHPVIAGILVVSIIVKLIVGFGNRGDK